MPTDPWLVESTLAFEIACELYRAFNRPRRKLRTTPNFLDRRTRLERFSDHSRNTLTEVGNRLGNADVMGRMYLGAVGDVALLDVLCRPADPGGPYWSNRVCRWGVHLPEEVAWLLIVFVVDPVVPVGGRSGRAIRALHE